MNNRDIKLNFLHICENAFFSDDKKLNIINIFDIINISNLPAIHPRFSLATGLFGDITKHKLFIEIKSPSGIPILESEYKEIKENMKNKTNLVINIVGVVFKEIGKYKILLKTEEGIIDEVNEYYFEVVKKEF